MPEGYQEYYDQAKDVAGKAAELKKQKDEM